MNIKSNKQTHNHTHIPPHNLYSLKLSQFRVGAQSLGKRTRSLRANVVARKTGAGGWECVSTTRALCLYSIISLLLSIIVILYNILCFTSLSYIKVLSTHIHTRFQRSLQLSQCHVGTQSLGKRTRSLGANIAVRETGAGGWEV